MGWIQTSYPRVPLGSAAIVELFTSLCSLPPLSFAPFFLSVDVFLPSLLHTCHLSFRNLPVKNRFMLLLTHILTQYFTLTEYLTAAFFSMLFSSVWCFLLNISEIYWSLRVCVSNRKYWYLSVYAYLFSPSLSIQSTQINMIIITIHGCQFHYRLLFSFVCNFILILF